MRRLALFTLLLALFTNAGCKDAIETFPANAAPLTTESVPVVVGHPHPLPTLTQVRAIGRLEAMDELQLSFKTGGLVAAVLVDIGDAVHVGQVLARLDSTEVDAEVKRAEEAFQKAQRDLERANSLHAQGLVSQEIYDNARMTRDVSEANQQAARFNQAHATIIAPANGRVLARRVKGREMVAPGVPVLTVSGEGSGWLLRVSVADKDSVLLAPNGKATVSIDAWPDHRFDARISRIAGMADPLTGTFDVEVALNAQKTPFRSGMIGRADMQVSKPAPGWAVPMSALIDANAGKGQLYIVDAGKASLRAVQLGPLLGENVTITGGIGVDDAIIVSGAAYVNDGQAVRLVTQ